MIAGLGGIAASKLYPLWPVPPAGVPHRIVLTSFVFTMVTPGGMGLTNAPSISVMETDAANAGLTPSATATKPNHKVDFILYLSSPAQEIRFRGIATPARVI